MKRIEKIIFLWSLLFLASCHHDKKDQAGQGHGDTVTVTATVAQTSFVSYYDVYPGNVIALKQVEIHADVGGYLTGIYFAEGTHVKAGQKLYEIDRRQYEAAYEQARNNVQISQSNLARVQQDFKRYEALSREDAIAIQQFEHARTDLDNAKLAVSSANQDLVKAKTNYEYSLITAPFDGTIGISQVKLGSLIVPGQTLLNTISSNDPVGVEFVIDEKELGRFVSLQEAQRKDQDSVFKIDIPGNSEYPFPGKIDIIDRAVDPQTGTIRVRLVFPNNEGLIRPGMSCSVKVLHKSTDEKMLIPFKALTEQMGEYFVFRISGDTAKQVKVSTGVTIGPKIIIDSGLNAGDRIVVEGMQKLHDGSVVKIGSPKKSEQQKEISSMGE